MRQLRIAYVGPGLSGRSTSLVHAQRRLRGASAVRRHLVADGPSGCWLEFSVESSDVRLTVLCGTGAIWDEQLRDRLVAVAHGVVLVLDSQVERLVANTATCEWLEPLIGDRPVVVQLNKRDLPNAMPVDELRQIVGKWGRSHVFESVAPRAKGVLQPFEFAALLAARTEGVESEVRAMINAQ